MTARLSATRRPLRRILIIAALAAFANPLASRADEAMDACVQAFIAANFPKEQPVVVDKESKASQGLRFQDRPYTIVLTATGRRSGQQVATGTCIVQRGGRIIALAGKRQKQFVTSTIATNRVTDAR